MGREGGAVAAIVEEDGQASETDRQKDDPDDTPTTTPTCTDRSCRMRGMIIDGYMQSFSKSYYS